MENSDFHKTVVFPEHVNSVEQCIKY